jgi:hypothetical protein
VEGQRWRESAGRRKEKHANVLTGKPKPIGSSSCGQATLTSLKTNPAIEVLLY